MPINGTYNVEYPISDGDLLTGANEETGKTIQVVVRDLAEYIQTNGTGKLAIYDGASSGSSYDESTAASSNLELRLEFTGAKTNEDHFPTQYGTLMVNQFSAPSGSSFDFRLLPAGQYLEFEVEFDAKITDSVNGDISPSSDYRFSLNAEFPNGNIEKRAFVVKSANKNSVQYKQRFAIKFTHLIDDVLTDALLGGKFYISSEEGVVMTDLLHVYDLVVRVRI